jgi:hypothetical protein
MAFDVLNVGSAPNDGNGESLRSGGQKINANFAKAVEAPAATVTNNTAVVFDGTTGKLVKQAGTSIAALAGKFAPTGNITAGNGMYLPAANTVAFSTNGSERLRITSAGNVGIGTTSPTNTLHIEGPGVRFGGQSYIYSGNVPSVTASTGTMVFTFENPGINAQSALIKLTVNARSSSNTPSTSPAAVYYGQLHVTSGNVATFNGATTVFEYTFVRATHLAFADLGSRQCTLTLSNPLNATLTCYYTIELQGPGWVFNGLTVT